MSAHLSLLSTETYPRVSQRALNRWGVAYTLINNPDLIRYTASKLALKKKLLKKGKRLLVGGPGQLNSRQEPRVRSSGAAEAVQASSNKTVEAIVGVKDPEIIGIETFGIMQTPTDTSGTVLGAGVLETVARNLDTNIEAQTDTDIIEAPVKHHGEIRTDVDII